MKNWRGNNQIQVRCYNGADPDLIWDGYVFNYWDIEDALWDIFLEETGYQDSQSGDRVVEKEFNDFVKERATDYLEDVIFGGYFRPNSKSWHDG